MNLCESEYLKDVFYNKQNEEQLKYFLETFLGMKKGEELEAHYFGIINEIYKAHSEICSDLIIIYGDYMIKINTYNLKDELIINIVYGTKNDDEIGKIIDIMLKEVINRLKVQKLLVEFEPSVKDLIASKGIDKNFGARPLRRTIQSLVEDKLADEILDGNIKKNKKAVVGVKDDTIVVN